MSLHRHVASPSYGTRFAARHEPRYPITLIACDTVALDRTSFHFRLGCIGDPFGHLERTPESRRSEAAGVTGSRSNIATRAGVASPRSSERVVARRRGQDEGPSSQVLFPRQTRD